MRRAPGRAPSMAHTQDTNRHLDRRLGIAMKSTSQCLWHAIRRLEMLLHQDSHRKPAGLNGEISSGKLRGKMGH